MIATRLVAPARREYVAVTGALGLWAVISWSSLLSGPMDATGDAILFASMWLWMVGATMLPTVVPMAATCVAVVRTLSLRARLVRLGAFLLPYLALWWAAGSIALAVHLVGQGRPLIVAALVALAGLYELGLLKTNCLRSCRNPTGFFLDHGPPDSIVHSAALGARHGLLCLGCCGGLMLALTAAGAFHPLWMVALGLVVLVEKTHRRGEQLGRLVGFALLLLAPLLLLGGDAPLIP